MVAQIDPDVCREGERMSGRKGDYYWCAASIAQLTALRAAGLSCGQIALQMGHGLTRNSIIGKAKRLHLPLLPRPPSKRALKRAFRIQNSEPTEPEPMPEMKAAAESKPTRLIDATSGQCRWILDGYDQPTVCGAPGWPWCPTHRARVYSQHGPRKELAA